MKASSMAHGSSIAKKTDQSTATSPPTATSQRSGSQEPREIATQRRTSSRSSTTAAAQASTRPPDSANECACMGSKPYYRVHTNAEWPSQTWGRRANRFSSRGTTRRPQSGPRGSDGPTPIKPLTMDPQIGEAFRGPPDGPQNHNPRIFGRSRA